MNWKSQNRSAFLHKKANLDQMVRHTFLEGDQAIIPCRVRDYSDIISPYSVEGCETLNPDFQAYILDIIRFIPDEYGIVLEIDGPEFSQEQQESIVSTVKTDMLYDLGEAEEQENAAFRNFLWMIAGCVGMGVFLTFAHFVLDIAHEFFYIVFWFFADTLVRYLLQERSDKRYSRLLAGRLASMSLRFGKKDG
ncbi:MAG: hypothetical protein MJ136_05295 [Clostridia bacterium]|nr:hypothetical protein [Clostridia bacterium]